MADRKYARKYLRIRPDDPIYAEMTIVRIGRDEVSTGKASIRVLDISPGGLRFSSVLNLPASGSVCLELRFRVSATDFRLKGCIVHKSSTEVREYEYGFCFLEPDATLRTALRELFNNMQVRMQKHIVILKFS